MFWKQLFATKSLEILQAEVKGENRLRRVLGPIALTASGIGAIIGSGIFVMTGRVAAQDAGPAVVLSFVVAGIGCLFAALCYAEFASMAPVAGSAYTYAYATLGELFAWIIGWDLILEYAMACACVASSWSKYLNELLLVFGVQVPAFLCSDPFTTEGAWFNLPALLITLLVTGILVVGIRESANANAILVAIKIGVVLFVIGAGVGYVSTRNWNEVPVADRILPEETLIPSLVKKEVKDENLKGPAAVDRTRQLTEQTLAAYKLDHRRKVAAQLLAEGKHTADKAEEMVQKAEAEYSPKLAQNADDKARVDRILAERGTKHRANPRKSGESSA